MSARTSCPAITTAKTRKPRHVSDGSIWTCDRRLTTHTTVSVPTEGYGSSLTPADYTLSCALLMTGIIFISLDYLLTIRAVRWWPTDPARCRMSVDTTSEQVRLDTFGTKYVDVESDHYPGSSNATRSKGESQTGENGVDWVRDSTSTGEPGVSH